MAAAPGGRIPTPAAAAAADAEAAVDPVEEATADAMEPAAAAEAEEDDATLSRSARMVVCFVSCVTGLRSLM